jgi:hypothetical protein
MAEGSAALAGIEPGDQRPHIIRVPGGDAETADIENQPAAGLAQRPRQIGAANGAGGSPEFFGDGGCGHDPASLFAARADRISATME